MNSSTIFHKHSDENRSGGASTLSKMQTEIPALVTVDVPEDMRKPSSPRKRSSILTNVSFDITNETIMPMLVKAKLDMFNNDFDQMFLTNVGHKYKVFSLLNQQKVFLKLSTSNEEKKMNFTNKDLGENLKVEKNMKIGYESLEEKSHSHRKGDPGKINRNDDRNMSFFR